MVGKHAECEAGFENSAAQNGNFQDWNAYDASQNNVEWTLYLCADWSATVCWNCSPRQCCWNSRDNGSIYQPYLWSRHEVTADPTSSAIPSTDQDTCEKNWYCLLGGIHRDLRIDLLSCIRLYPNHWGQSLDLLFYHNWKDRLLHSLGLPTTPNRRRAAKKSSCQESVQLVAEQKYEEMDGSWSTAWSIGKSFRDYCVATVFREPRRDAHGTSLERDFYQISTNHKTYSFLRPRFDRRRCALRRRHNYLATLMMTQRYSLCRDFHQIVELSWDTVLQRVSY